MTNKDINVPINDCISRAEAIEKIESHTRVGDELYPLTDTDRILNHAFEIAASCVYNLPAAQPETHDKRTETHACDCISREAAIDQLRQSYNLLDAEQRLEDLPSAQPTDADIQKMQDIEQAMLDKAYECGKQDAMQWIPWTSGRFPEESGTYTVTAYDGATNRVTYAKYQKRLKRWELTGARAYWRVVAWMPLPESYRG